MDERAFWIGPDGTIYPVMRSHIALVIAEPERFGLNRGEIEAVYKEHHEPLGWEGRAREEIIKGLIAKGWIRVRQYDRYLTIQLPSLDRSTASRLLSFFKSMAGRYSTEMDVRLGLLGDEVTKITTVAEFELSLMVGRDRQEGLR